MFSCGCGGGHIFFLSLIWLRMFNVPKEISRFACPVMSCDPCKFPRKRWALQPFTTHLWLRNWEGKTVFTNASVGKLGRGCCDGLSAKMPQKCIGNIYMVEFGSTPPKEIIMSPRKGKGPFQKENSLPSCMSYVSFRGGGAIPSPFAIVWHVFCISFDRRWWEM